MPPLSPRPPGELIVKSFFMIFRSIAAPSRSAAMLMAAPKTPLPAGPPSATGVFRAACPSDLNRHINQRRHDNQVPIMLKSGETA
jgi:hypothetical protein